MNSNIIVTKRKNEFILTAFTQRGDKIHLYDFDGLGERFSEIDPLFTESEEHASALLDLRIYNDRFFNFTWENTERLPTCEEIQEQNIAFFL